MKNIVLTGGGTAGHVTPCLALLPALIAEGYTVSYIGMRGGIEETLIKKAGIPFYPISAGKLRRYLSAKNITDAFRVVKGIGGAVRILKKIKPAAVFSKGGFVGVPVTYAARILKIPVILHEGDFSLGLANRLSAPYAKAVCVCFPETQEKAPKGKSYLTGMPLRGELFSGSREAGMELCGFSGSNKPVLLVMGGSSGAVRINNAVTEALPALLDKFNIIHLCGKGNYNNEINMPGYYQTEYAAEEMPDIYAAADIAVSRAGANAVFELLALKKPMLLIPLGAQQSRGDQILNAISFEKQGFARVLMQEDMNAHILTAGIMSVWDNADEYINKMNTAQETDAVSAIIRIINESIAPRQNTR